MARLHSSRAPSSADRLIRCSVWLLLLCCCTAALNIHQHIAIVCYRVCSAVSRYCNYLLTYAFNYVQGIGEIIQAKVFCSQCARAFSCVSTHTHNEPTERTQLEDRLAVVGLSKQLVVAHGPHTQVRAKTSNVVY